MAEPFIGQIEMFAGNFAPRGWAFCNGQLIAISQNSALFSILGTTYGGDGRTTFGLPDLRGRAPIHTGGAWDTGPGLSTYRLGQRSGLEENYLNVLHLPSHNHQVFNGSQSSGLIKTGDTDNLTDSPVDAYPTVLSADFGGEAVTSQGYSSTPSNHGMANDSVVIPLDGTTTLAGGSHPVNNVQPYLAVNFIIAMFGTYPSRN